jgi:hypothetical protein
MMNEYENQGVRFRIQMAKAADRAIPSMDTR